MIGDGPSHTHLQTVFRGTPTVFTGYLQGDALVAAYRSADAFLFPSTTETFGLVALEAMACGLPVIAARTGGVLDIVTDGQNGFFFDPDEPQQIGPLIARLQHNGALREALAQHALHHARSRDWRMTMDQLIQYYHLAISVAQHQARHRRH
jgi:glycosyltransferase involved in cell wall biosynthesis